MAFLQEATCQKLTGHHHQTHWGK